MQPKMTNFRIEMMETLKCFFSPFRLSFVPGALIFLTKRLIRFWKFCFWSRLLKFTCGYTLGLGLRADRTNQYGGQVQTAINSDGRVVGSIAYYTSLYYQQKILIYHFLSHCLCNTLTPQTTGRWNWKWNAQIEQKWSPLQVTSMDTNPKTHKP